MWRSRAALVAILACLLAWSGGCGRRKTSASSACPEGSSGDGSASKPCKPADKSSRLLRATLLGDPKGPLKFKLQNLSGKKLQLLQLKMWFYDSAGKQLRPNLRVVGERDSWVTSLNLPGGIAPKGELEQALGPSPEEIPTGTATIELEAYSAGWDCDQPKGCQGHWSNLALAPDKRTQQSSAK